MKDKAPVRNGSLSDAELAADCDDRATACETYAVALTEEGLTPALVVNFRKENAAFRKLPTDDNLAKQATAAVEDRDAALEAARTGLRKASQPIGRAYGDESPEYRSFDVGEVSRKSVPVVLNLLQTVPGVAAAYLTDAKALAEGFGPARLAPLPGLYQELFDREAAIGRLETAAQLGTRTRILAYNALNTRCADFCAKGYDHFEETDALAAKAFVRHPASHPAAPVVPPVVG